MTSETTKRGIAETGSAPPFRDAPDPHPSHRPVSRGLKLAGSIVRLIFMCALLVVIVLVARPQSETIWTAYETPADLVRMALGLAAGIWIVVHLFIPPRDPSAYRTWIYLGLVLLPLALIYAIVMWDMPS
jgi:hypothetical protein